MNWTENKLQSATPNVYIPLTITMKIEHRMNALYITRTVFLSLGYFILRYASEVARQYQNHQTSQNSFITFLITITFFLPLYRLF